MNIEPCPFCKGQARVYGGNSVAWVECQNGKCNTNGPSQWKEEGQNVEDKAIQLWNTMAVATKKSLGGNRMEIERCPFCGAQATIWGGDRVICPSDSVCAMSGPRSLMGEAAEAEADAIQMWNTMARATRRALEEVNGQ